MTRIHVSTRAITHNDHTGERTPAIVVHRDEGTTLCRRVEVLGPSALIQDEEHPFSSPHGQARIWVETDAEVVCL